MSKFGLEFLSNFQLELTAYFTWQSLFVVLGIISVIALFLIIFFLKETHHIHRRTPFNFKQIGSGYYDMLRNRKHMTIAMCIFFPYAWLLVVLTASPFIFMVTYHVSKIHYGFLVLSVSISMSIGGVINVYLNKKPRKHRGQLLFGCYLTIIAGALFCSSVMFNFDSATLTVILMDVVAFGMAFTYINAVSVLLKLLDKNVGLETALAGCFQMAGAGIVTYIASFCHISSCFSLGIILLVCSLIPFFLILTLPKTTSAPTTSSKVAAH